MKKSLYFILILLLMITVGCTNENTEQTTPPKEVKNLTNRNETGDNHKYRLISDNKIPFGPSEVEQEEPTQKKENKEEDQEIEQKQEVKKPERTDIKGIYLNRTSLREDKIDEFIDFVKASKLNAVVMDIKDDYGKLTYDSNIDKVNEIGSDSNPPIKDLKAFIKRLKDEGIYTIGRIVVFKDPFLVNSNPEYAIKRKDGTVWKDAAGTQWLDPHKKEIWEYMTDVSSEVAESGIDEIQYDYVRFPENAKQVNKEVSYDNPDNLQKEEVIENFLIYSNDRLKDKSVYLSADVFGLVTSSDDDMGIGQKWERLSPNLDYISPMTYPSHYAPNTYGIGNPDAQPYDVMINAMQDAKERNEKLKQNGKETAFIRPWVQDFDYKRAYTKDDVLNQMKALEDEGITQFLIWNAQNVYTKEAFK